jgi:hypothetical protein
VIGVAKEEKQSSTVLSDFDRGSKFYISNDRFAPAAAVRAKSAFETLSRHSVIAPITTTKILTVAPELCLR